MQEKEKKIERERNDWTEPLLLRSILRESILRRVSFFFFLLLARIARIWASTRCVFRRKFAVSRIQGETKYCSRSVKERLVCMRFVASMRARAARIELANEFLEIFMPRVSRGRVILASRGSRGDAPRRLKENNFLRELFPATNCSFLLEIVTCLHAARFPFFFGVTALVFSLICCNIRRIVSMGLIDII